MQFEKRIKEAKHFFEPKYDDTVLRNNVPVQNQKTDPSCLWMNM